jgi:excisionase family DNA binding protein
LRTFTLAEAARLIGTSRGTLYRAIEAGRLTYAAGGGPGKSGQITEEALRQAGFQVPPEVEHLERLPNILGMSPATSHKTFPDAHRFQALEQRVEHLERLIIRLEREVDLALELLKSVVGQPLPLPSPVPPAATASAPPSLPPRSKDKPLSGVRQQIVTLLRAHPDGLPPAQVRALLPAEKDVADTMRGMSRDGILRRLATGRYVVVEGW